MQALLLHTFHGDKNQLSAATSSHPILSSYLAIAISLEEQAVAAAPALPPWRTNVGFIYKRVVLNLADGPQLGLFLVWHGPARTPADLRSLRLRFNTPYTFLAARGPHPPLTRPVALLWFQMADLTVEEKLEVSNLARNITRKLEARERGTYVIDRAANPALRVVQRLYNLYKHASTHKKAHISIFLQLTAAVAVVVTRAFSDEAAPPLRLSRRVAPQGNVAYFYDWLVVVPWHYNTHDDMGRPPSTRESYEVHSRFIDYAPCHFVYEDRWREAVRKLVASVVSDDGRRLWP